MLNPTRVLGGSPSRPAIPAKVPGTVRAPVAAGIIAATLLGTSAAIEIARAWILPPPPLAEAGHALGGIMVALFVLAAIGVGARARPLAGLAITSAIALLAHGIILVLQGETVGALFIGIAPIVFMLAKVAFMKAPAVPEPPTSARIDIAWAIAKSRQKTARAAGRAASPSHLAMHA